jgi:flagellar protein FliS
MNRVLQTYQKNSTTTATPAELTLMLYNAGIKFTKQAKQAIEKKQILLAHDSIIRLQDIVQELMITLNMDIPISQQFLTMYDYMLHRLIESNINKDSVILDEIEDLFTQFRDTWKEAMVLAKKPIAETGSV